MPLRRLGTLRLASPRRLAATALAMGALTAGALTAGAPSPAAAAPTGRCTMSGSDTILANRQARFFVKRNRRTADIYYACRYRTNRRIRLAKATGECNDEAHSVESPRLAGRFVAFVAVSEGCTEGRYAEIVTVNLASRKRRSIHPPASKPRRVALATSEVEDLELKSDGSVAWIASGEEDEPDEDRAWVGREVGLLRPRDSRSRVLDSGSDIEPDSLRLSRARVHWTKGGNPFSASLRRAER